jgi:hypothetical protein
MFLKFVLESAFSLNPILAEQNLEEKSLYTNALVILVWQ